MTLRLIGVGIKSDGSKEPFTVSDKTTKAGLESIIKGYESISAIVDTRNNAMISVKSSANLWKALDLSPMGKMSVMETDGATQINSTDFFGMSSERVRNAALIGLLENDQCEIMVTLFLGEKSATIRDPTVIRARLEQLKMELSE